MVMVLVDCIGGERTSAIGSAVVNVDVVRRRVIESARE